MTYSPTKFEVATPNGSGGDTFTRNVTDGPFARTDGQTDGRRTDFDTKLIYPFFLKKKVGIINPYVQNKTIHNSIQKISFSLDSPLSI